MTNPIFKRTSVRSYTGEKISEDKIELLMKAAMAAPSACNAQPWEFIIVQEKSSLKQIMTVHPFSQMLENAALAIVVCADLNKKPKFCPDIIFWPQDCAAASENILIQAADMNLGGVWLGVYPRKEIQEGLSSILNLPSNIMPFSILSIGVPNKEQKPMNKFDKNKIHYNKW